MASCKSMFNSHSNPSQFLSKASAGATPTGPAVSGSNWPALTETAIDAELRRVAMPDGLLHRLHVRFDAFLTDESNAV
jgi:hypothetical protein